MRNFPGKPILLRVTEGRIKEIGEQIHEIWTTKVLKPGLAGKMFGRLLFCSSQFYGNLGKSMIRAFKRRQYESLCGWNRQLEASCAFWSNNLPWGKAREVPMSFEGIPLVVSYSDGEGTDAGVGIAIWKEGEPTEAGYMRTPAAVRKLWSRQKDLNSEHYDILEIEAIGPAMVLATWPHKFKGCLWVHFIDN